MGRAVNRYRKWRWRCWAGGTLLMAAAVAPLIYCMGWGVEGATLGVCVESHVLLYPTALFLSGAALFLTGLLLVNRERESQAQAVELERRVARAAARQEVRTPMLDRQAMRGAPVEVPEEIELEEELDLGSMEPEDEIKAEEDAASVMAFLQEAQAARPVKKAQELPPGLEGVYCPPGMESAAVLYLDAGVEAHSVADASRRVGNPSLPHTSLDEALRQAFELVMNEGRSVMVRVMPGVYRAGVEIPDRVALVNHRMPAQATVDQRLAWLREQRDIDHPDRVTLLAPSKTELALRLVPGQKQGVFGCYLVGRRGVVQRGLLARDSAAVAIVHCGFEGFSNGAVVLEGCGEDLPGRRVQFVGCLWRGNAAPKRGGALLVKRSVVSVEASIFDSNTAPVGGAIAVVKTEKPFRLERSLLQRNRARSEAQVPQVEELSLRAWRRAQGMGGALVVQEGLAKVVDTIFEGNDAAVGGGALAVLGGRVVFKSTGAGRGVCRENRAETGGGLLAVGWLEAPAMIRCDKAELKSNLAKSIGGGAAAVGGGILHFEGGEVTGNRAAGSGRSGPGRAITGGMGGGIAAWRGATVQARELMVSQNRAASGGGGVAVVNGHLKMVEGTSVSRNQADDAIGGGGVLVLTLADEGLERLVSRSEVTMPFKLKIDGVRIIENRAGGPGAGLRGGNAGGEATFPLLVLIRRPDWINQNHQQGEQVQGGDDIWIQWAGSLRAKDGARGRLKLALQ